jgi:hypothetical protein
MRASGPWEADVRMVEVELAISLTDECASGPILTDIQTVIFELRFLPYLWARPDGKPHRPKGVSIFPYSELWKESEAGQSLLGVRTDESWNRSFSIQWKVRTERYVVRTDDASLSGVRSGWTCHSNGWNSGQMDVRTGWHVVWTADRESEIFYLFRNAESSENALTSGIPVYSIFTHKWFCPNTECGQNTNNR